MGVRPAAPPTELKPLPWRRPWFRAGLRWLAILLLVIVFIFLWQRRMQETPPFTVERETIPTPVIEATPTPPRLYLPPTIPPPGWSADENRG